MHAERFIAERVERERVARGWSYEGLAQRMTKLGCPINQSAIYRIEAVTPPRRITADEALGFAEVFGLTVEEIYRDPVLAEHEEVVDLVRRWWSLAGERQQAVDRMDRELAALEQQLTVRSSASPALAAVITAAMQSGPELKDDAGNGATLDAGAS